MAVELIDAVNFDGLFDLLGKAFFAQATLETAIKTTVPTEVIDALDQFKLRASDLDIEGAEDSLPGSITVLQQGGIGSQALIQRYCQQLLIRMVDDDTPLDSPTLKNALVELIDQMEDSGDDVDASTVTATAAMGGSNVGDGVIVVSAKRGDGRFQENMLAETILGLPTSDGLTASIRFVTAAKAGLLYPSWPAGSGIAVSLSPVAPSNQSLLLNGDFEDENDVTNAPDDWTVVVGTIGTTLKITDVEVQTVVISSTPTTGHMLLHWTAPNGDTFTTEPIFVGASAATVQSALRAFDGLESITVARSGTSPNFTYTITFTGKGGNVNQLTSTNRFDTGSIAHNTTSAGTGQVFQGGKALEFDSDGAELTQIRQRITGLKGLTAYAVSLWGRTDTAPAAGVVTIDLVNGAGTVIADAQGTNNSFTFNAADVSDSAWEHLDSLVSGDPVFRLPEVVPDVVYFRIRITTAISNTSSLYLDAVQLAEMTELYPGGPLAAAFAGSTRLRTTDEFTITCANNYAGEFQKWFNRNFDMASLGLLLPSDTGGSETIADSLIA